jgi:ParB family chromosome partitioning protein
MDVPIDSIVPDPDQPRKRFDEQPLVELAESITAHGVISPLIVRPDGAGGYVLVAGERRWRAAKIAGVQRVPIVERVDDVAEVQVLENVARLDMTPMEEARAIARIAGDRDPAEVGKRIGRSAWYVTSRLALLKLAPPLQGLTDSGQLQPATARVLAKLEHEQQYRVVKAVIDGGLTAGQTERLVEQMQATQEPMFDVPVRTARQEAARSRLIAALDAATSALEQCVDRDTRQVLPQAVTADGPLLVQRLELMEKETRRVRDEVKAAMALRQEELWSR